jgi:hypothetical protein
MDIWEAILVFDVKEGEEVQTVEISLSCSKKKQLMLDLNDVFKEYKINAVLTNYYFNAIWKGFHGKKMPPKLSLLSKILTIKRKDL